MKASPLTTSTRGRSIKRSLTNTFRVSVRGEAWFISTRSLDRLNRVESARDTECLRTVHAQFRGGTNAATLWANVAWVEPRESPSYDDPFLQNLWLAYCSPTSLLASTNGTLEPIWTQDNPLWRSQGFRVPARWALDDQPPGLPREVCFLSDGIYRGYDHARAKPVEMLLPPPYHHGYTCAVYRVHAWTNLMGLSLPVEFSFRTSRTPLGAGVSPDMPRDVLLAQVSKVLAEPSVEVFRPRFEGEASIHDYRFGEKLGRAILPEGFASYNAVEGRWPEGKELDDLVYKYTRLVASWQREPPRTGPSPHTSSRGLATTVLLLAICSPVTILILRGWQIRRKRTQTSHPQTSKTHEDQSETAAANQPEHH